MAVGILSYLGSVKFIIRKKLKNFQLSRKELIQRDLKRQARAEKAGKGGGGGGWGGGGVGGWWWSLLGTNGSIITGDGWGFYLER